MLVQPDLGSTLVFVPITLAMCYAAGARGREVVAVVVLGLAAFVLAYFTSMHGYQKQRVDVWAEHWEDTYSKKVNLWRKALSELPSEVAEKISHGNAERLYRLN